jgi:hypothetical protein
MVVQGITMAMCPLVLKRYGLQLPWLVLACLQTTVFASLFLSRSLELSILLMAVYGFVGCRCAFTFSFLSDLVPTKRLPIVSTLYFVLDGLTVCI